MVSYNAFCYVWFRAQYCKYVFYASWYLCKINTFYLEAGQINVELLSKLNAGGLFNNLIPVTLGNILGGAMIIGLAYWYVNRYSS